MGVTTFVKASKRELVRVVASAVAGDERGCEGALDAEPMTAAAEEMSLRERAGRLAMKFDRVRRAAPGFVTFVFIEEMEFTIAQDKPV